MRKACSLFSVPFSPSSPDRTSQPRPSRSLARRPLHEAKRALRREILELLNVVISLHGEPNNFRATTSGCDTAIETPRHGSSSLRPGISSNNNLSAVYNGECEGGEIGEVWVINVISDKTEPAPVSRDQLYSRGGRGWRDNENNRGTRFRIE